MNSAKLTHHTAEAETSDLIEVAALRSRVDKLLEERRQTAKWLYTAVGMSKAGWFQMWNSGSIKVTVLFSIARALNMDVGTLVNPILNPGVLQEPPATYQARPKYLEERVDDLERELHELKKTLHRK